MKLVDAAVQLGLRPHYQLFCLTEIVAHPAVIGLCLQKAGLVVIAVLDELVAQIDDVGQLSLGFAHVLDGDVQPDIGGFQR